VAGKKYKKKIPKRTKAPNHTDAAIIDDKAISSILKSLENGNIKLNEQAISDLKEASKEYLADTVLLNGLPRISALRKKLIDVNETSHNFVDMLEKMDISTRSLLKKYSDWVDLSNNFLNKAKFLQYAAEEALKGLPKDPGGPDKKKAPLEIYIRQIAKVYKNSTGLKPTISNKDASKGKGIQPDGEREFYSPFYDFIAACVSNINPQDFWANAALGSTIQRALKES